MNRVYIPDEDIYTELQILKDFVSFTISLPFADDKYKKTAASLIQLIEDPVAIRNNRDWYVSLDIFDIRHWRGQFIPEKDIYHRSWSVYMEKTSIEIEAKSSIYDVPPNDISDEHYYYHYSHYFDRIPSEQNHLFTAPLSDFLADAKNFRFYSTGFLTDMELDIFCPD